MGGRLAVCPRRSWRGPSLNISANSHLTQGHLPSPASRGVCVRARSAGSLCQHEPAAPSIIPIFESHRPSPGGQHLHRRRAPRQAGHGHSGPAATGALVPGWSSNTSSSCAPEPWPPPSAMARPPQPPCVSGVGYAVDENGVVVASFQGPPATTTGLTKPTDSINATPILKLAFWFGSNVGVDRRGARLERGHAHMLS